MVEESRLSPQRPRRPSRRPAPHWTQGSSSIAYATLVIPAAAVVAFVAWPALSTLIHSLLSLNARGEATGFAGLTNYRALFTQPLFGHVLANTAWFTLAAATLSVLTALALAFLLARLPGKHPMARALLVAIFSPTIIPTIAAANLWLYFLAPQIGLVDNLMRGLGLGGENWLGQPQSALAVMVALFLWKYAPYYALFLLAGMQAVPRNVRDALRLDDPRGILGVWRVLLPLLAPMLLFVTVLALLNAVETVDPIYVMTQGGPNNGTNLIMYYLYQMGFEFFAWGPAAALSAIMMAVLSSLSAIALIALERRAFHWQ